MRRALRRRDVYKRQGYTMLTLPDGARQEMIDYYAQNYAGTNEPSVMEMEDE